MPISPSALRGFQKHLGHPAGHSEFLKSPPCLGGFKHLSPQKDPNFLYKFGEGNRRFFCESWGFVGSNSKWVIGTFFAEHE